MHSDNEHENWESIIGSLGPDVDTAMEPVELHIPYVLSSVVDLEEAVVANHDLALISDEQRDIGLGFCDNLRQTDRPEAEIAELPIQEDDDGLTVWLILPRLNPQL